MIAQAVESQNAMVVDMLQDSDVELVAEDMHVRLRILLLSMRTYLCCR